MIAALSSMASKNCSRISRSWRHVIASRCGQIPLAAWELRLGDLRVYYRVRPHQMIVDVAAVGIKRRNEIWIGGERTEI